MHELTLLYGVAKKVEEVVAANDFDHVDAVVLEVGEATTIVPEFLKDGYEIVSDDYDFLRGSELIINRIPAIGVCRDCGTVFNVTESKGKCPECDSRDKELVAGTDFYIKEVRVMEKEGDAQ